MRNVAGPPVVVIELKKDSGVSAGRNALVQRMAEEGYEYAVIMDDDYLLTASFDLARMLR